MCACLHTLRSSRSCWRWGEKSVRMMREGVLPINQRHSFGCCACAKWHVIVLNAEAQKSQTHVFPYFLAQYTHMSACKYKQLWDYMRFCRRECACNSSQQETTTLLAAYIHTHPHLLCGCCGEVLSLVVLPQQHHSSTHSALMWDHIKQRGDILCSTVRAKALLNTYVDGTNTGVRERSSVQSHVALHHIHQHSALSWRALGPSLQTALACAKHQSASQSAQVRKANVS